MVKEINRRTLLGTAAAGAAAAAFPMPFISRAWSADPILLGLPTAQTAAAGVADDLDHLNGTTLAMEEINAAGGILGRELQAVRDRCRQAVARKLPAVDCRLHRRQGACDLQRVPVRPHSGDGRVRQIQMPLCPGQHAARGDRDVQVGPREVQPHFPDRSVGSPLRLHLSRSGWSTKKPRAYGSRRTARSTSSRSRSPITRRSPRLPRRRIKKRGKFEVAEVTDIQFPVQDWAPGHPEDQGVDAAAIMIDHWVAAEYAAFCKQFLADPVKDSLVYLQYGPVAARIPRPWPANPPKASAGRRCSASMPTKKARRSAKNTRSVSPASWGWLHRQWLRHRPVSEARLGSRRRSEQLQGGLRLDPHQSLSRRLRLYGHEQRPPGMRALPGQWLRDHRRPSSRRA